MEEFAGTAGIDYPIAVDAQDATVGAYAVDSYPDYYLIDRAGKLRLADLANAELERAIVALLAEPAPGSVPGVLARASATATTKDKRILVAWGDGAGKALVEIAASSPADLQRLLDHEYELVSLTRRDEPRLAASLGVASDAATLTVLDARAALLGRLEPAPVDAAALGAFLEKHRVPVVDAEAAWREALERAQREDKRLLVHLGAPW